MPKPDFQSLAVRLADLLETAWQGRYNGPFEDIGLRVMEILEEIEAYRASSDWPDTQFGDPQSEPPSDAPAAVG